MSAERNTRQRRTIREVVERAGRPLTTDEILGTAQATIPALGRATVYRSIRALLDEGWLTAVDVPGRSALYERAGKGHHHHFQCSHCKRVYELAGCERDSRRATGGLRCHGPRRHDIRGLRRLFTLGPLSKATERMVKNLPLRDAPRG
jgi:Fur family ferric uptake transcriptional regulator